MADVLPLAIAIAASPFPIVPAILLLFTARPRATAGAFLAGWIAGIGAATTVFVLLAEVVETRDYTPAWASWTRVALGLVIVALGIRQWLTRGDAEAPAWMASLAEATPRTAARLGLLLSAANPKVVLLAAAGGLAIGAAGQPAATVVTWTVVFTLVAAVSVTVPVVLYLARGERILRPLGVARDWLQDHNAAIMAVVLVVIGLALLLKGIDGL